jgi:flagellar biosynthesis protein FlhF
MKMKTFQADTMQEALSMVKEEMGPDAIILKSRRASRKVGGKVQACFEVTAAQEESLAARANAMQSPAATEVSTYNWKGSLHHVDETGKTKQGRTVSAPHASLPANSGSLLELLRNEIREMKDQVSAPSQEMKDLKNEIKAMMESAAARTQAAIRSEATRVASIATSQKTLGRVPAHSSMPGHPEMHGLREHLLEMEVESELASELLQASSLRNSGRRVDAAFGSSEAMDKELEVLAQCMAEKIRVTGGIRLMPGRPTTVALVGPTGVGKTTTLAKLATLAKMQQGKKVGIISADSFRMGANEQLELFGRTAGIPVRPVFSPADVAQAQQDFANYDLILVDTAGRSHTHLEMWSELQGLLRCLHPDEIHLVLSGPTRMRELRHQYGLYRDLGASSLIFTKLDECLTLGCLYNLARRAEAPLSYLCNGQVIPDHIQLAQPVSVASAITTSVKALMSFR